MVGARIRTYRRKKHFTLSDLSASTGISKSYLSNIERGIQKNPSLKVLSLIAESLDINLDDLLEKQRIKKHGDELDWISFIQEIQAMEISKKESDYILAFIKFNRRQGYEYE